MITEDGGKGGAGGTVFHFTLGIGSENHEIFKKMRRELDDSYSTFSSLGFFGWYHTKWG